MEATTIKWEDWESKYKPQENHITKAASGHEDHAPFNNWMYETYGPELEFVESIDQTEPERVWTILDVDDLVICSGFHRVNRFGYIICEVPFEKDVILEVENDD